MDAYYVRIYTLQNGEQIEAPVVHQCYEQAEADLDKFRLHPEFDLSQVAHIRIEKRYCPRPFWVSDVTESKTDATNRGNLYTIKVALDRSELANQLRELADILSPQNGEGNGSLLKVSD
ncbi:hypothetical protein [Alicyclobacillus sendaiensis]|uniref:hypothetical protein n=1 Tax=Alicyclobacillus sendaiensis TaxID=192387 RepID=UPI0007806F81|nr:hypothetical protein [Alicyclobacillus sendaiensis]